MTGTARRKESGGRRPVPEETRRWGVGECGSGPGGRRPDAFGTARAAGVTEVAREAGIAQRGALAGATSRRQPAAGQVAGDRAGVGNAEGDRDSGQRGGSPEGEAPRTVT